MIAQLVETLVASGLIVDIALAVLALEFVAVILVRRRAGRTTAIAPALWNLGAGAGLLLALRAALVGASPVLVLVPLSLALVCHLADTAHRLAAKR